MIEPWKSTSDALAKLHKRMRNERRITPASRHNLPFEPLRLVTEDGVELAAWYIPAKEPSTRGVVLHHHFGGQKAYLLPWLALFHRLGLAAIAFDARGHGGSQGKLRLDSFSKRGADARAAAKALRERGVTELIGFGQSQGGAVMLLGLEKDPGLRGLIVDSGPAPELWTAVWGVAKVMLGDAGRKGRLAQVLLSVRLLVHAEPIHYLATLWRALYNFRGRPLLWLHGGKDDVIPHTAGALWYRAFAGALWRQVLIESAGHVRTLQDGGERIEQAVADFVRDALRDAP